MACTKVETEPKKELIATVNGVEILRERFESLVESEKKNREMQGVDFESEEGIELLKDIKDFVLEDMIRMELVHQLSEQKGHTVTEEEVNEYLEEIYASYDGEENFKQQLLDMGFTFDMIKDFIISDIKTKKIIEEEITEIEISEDEIRQQYDAIIFQNGEETQGLPTYEEAKDRIEEELVMEKKYQEFNKIMEDFKANSVIKKFNAND